MIPGQKNNHPTFRRSFLFAIQGFVYTLKTERNIKVMLAAAIAVVILGSVFHLDVASWAIVLLCCGCVTCAELMNTSIETVVDLVSPEYHPLAGHAKDIAAAGVYIMSVFAAIVGLIVFIHAIFFA